MRCAVLWSLVLDWTAPAHRTSRVTSGRSNVDVTWHHSYRYRSLEPSSVGSFVPGDATGDCHGEPLASRGRHLRPADHRRVLRVRELADTGTRRPSVVEMSAGIVDAAVGGG